MAHFHKAIGSPVGTLTLVAGDAGLEAVQWVTDGLDRTWVKDSAEDLEHPVLLEAEKQLNEYFAKKRQVFDLPLHFSGSEFQKEVWAALLRIPFGQTRTYGDVAREIGDPGSVRAVGGAANKNPIAIIAPCHRVIGADGKLVGFGGGLKNKAILLELERALQAPTLF